MKDLLKKRFRAAFCYETATDFSFHDTLAEAKRHIMKFIKSPGTLFDLEAIQIWDQHDGDRRVKFIDGDRLFKRYFPI